MHWRARRLLSWLPDGLVEPELEIEVRAHAASCARCRRVLRDQERSEAFLRGLPPNIVPLEWKPECTVRLAALSRWSAGEDWPAPERWRAPILSLASVVAFYILAATISTWAPIMPDTSRTLTLAAVPPDSTLAPGPWIPGRH